MITAVWWLVFTIPMWRHVHQVHYTEHQGNVISQSFQRISTVGKRIIKIRPLVYFLIAYFFYIDGVGTIIHMATIFGTNMGLDSNYLIVILLVVQLVAFPFAILYGKMSVKYGVRNMILFGIATYMAVCLVALGLEPLRLMGEIQAAVGFCCTGFPGGHRSGRHSGA